MAVTTVQVGNDNVNNNGVGVTSVHDSLPAPATAGNLLVFFASTSIGFSHMTTPAGFSLAQRSTDTGSPVQMIWLKTAVGGEQTVTLTSDGTTSALDCRIMEFNSATALAAGVYATLPITVASNAPGALTTPAATRSGDALAVSNWSGSGSLSGFAAAGWTVDVSGRAARAYKALTTVAGTTTASITPTWTTARTGEGLILLLTPRALFFPRAIVIT